jgi:hypothetical protein
MWNLPATNGRTSVCECKEFTGRDWPVTPSVLDCQGYRILYDTCTASLHQGRWEDKKQVHEDAGLQLPHADSGTPSQEAFISLAFLMAFVSGLGRGSQSWFQGGAL